MKWQRIKVADLLARKPKTLNPAKSPSEVFTLYSIPAFDRGRPDVQLGSEIGSSKQILQQGDVLLSKIVPHIRRSWVVGKPEPNQLQIGSSEWIVFRTKLVDPHYLSKVLVGDEFHNAFMQTVAGVGGSLRRARPAAVAELDIPVPPLNEQRRMAVVLDKADALRRQRRESLQLTELLLHSVFLDMFGSETSPRCPRVKLSEYLEFITTGGRGWAKYYTDHGAKFIRSMDVRMNEIDSSQMVHVTPPQNAEAKRTRTQVGDVLLTMTGSLIGRVAPVSDQYAGGHISQHVAILRTPGFEPDFLSWAISTQEGQRQIQKHQTGQTKPGLNFDQVKRLLIPRPTIEDERTFCDLIRRRRSILAEQRASLEQCDTLFASIQQRAFRGGLDLSGLQLAPEQETPAVNTQPTAAAVEGRYTRPGSFIASPEIEQQLLEMEKQLEGDQAEPLQWSEDFFKYRTLSQILTPPYSFAKVWAAVEQDFEQPSYETVKKTVFEYVAAGVLQQEFDEASKEIVFRPTS